MDFFNLNKTAYTLAIEPNYVYSQPFRLTIEPTTRCNLSCSMCYLPAGKRQAGNLGFSSFVKILTQFPYLKDLQLQGIGEPLLNPEIFEMVRFAKSRKILTGLFSNATLLSKDIANKIIESGLDWINLSFDAVLPDTYEAIRKGADFKEVLGNINNLLDVKKNGTPKVSLWFTAMKGNIRELPALIRLTKQLGIEKITAQGIHFWGDDERRFSLKQSSLANYISLTREIFIEAREEAKKNKVKLDFRPRYFQRRTKRICHWPWVSCFITVEGYVTSCCVQGSNPQIINFGNIFEQDFRDIWNSQHYQDFRRQLKSKYPPEICKDCPGYYYK